MHVGLKRFCDNKKCWDCVASAACGLHIEQARHEDNTPALTAAIPRTAASWLHAHHFLWVQGPAVRVEMDGQYVHLFIIYECANKHMIPYTYRIHRVYASKSSRHCYICFY